MTITDLIHFPQWKPLDMISHVFLFDLYAVHVYENQISGGKNRRTGNSRIVEILNPKKLIWQYCCF